MWVVVGGWLKQRLPSQTDWTQGLGEDAYLLHIDQCAQVKPAISTHTQGEISCMATWSTIVCNLKMNQILNPTTLHTCL